MSKNNPLRKMTRVNRNYKLYKVKKQWITACATVLLTLGFTSVFQVNAHAATKSTNTGQISTIAVSKINPDSSAADNVASLASAGSSSATNSSTSQAASEIGANARQSDQSSVSQSSEHAQSNASSAESESSASATAKSFAQPTSSAQSVASNTVTSDDKSVSAHPNTSTASSATTSLQINTATTKQLTAQTLLASLQSTDKKINATLNLADYASSFSQNYNGAPAKVSEDDLKSLEGLQGVVVGADGNTYALTIPDDINSATDLSWLDSHGHPLSSTPAKRGDYYFYFNDNGIKKLNVANPEFNLTYDPNQLKAEAGFYTINNGVGTATISNTASASRVYNGQPVSVDDFNSGDITFTVIYPKDGNDHYREKVALTPIDFRWYDASGKELTQAPTEVGTYTLRINRSTVTNTLRRIGGSGEDGRSPNVTFDISTTAAVNKALATFTIEPGAQVTIKGTQTYTPTENPTTKAANPITDADINVANYSEQWNTLTGTDTDNTENNRTLSQGDLTFVDATGNPTAAPTHPGTYYVGLTSAAYQKFVSAATQELNKLYPNNSYTYGFNHNVLGTFYVKGVGNYSFIDTDDNNQQVGETVTKTGLTTDPAQTVSMTIPDNYVLATGQTVPSSWEATNTSPLIANVQILLKHKTTTAAESQNRTLTVKYVNGVTGKSMGNLAPDAQLQVHYTGTKVTDLVTGKVTNRWEFDDSYNDNGFKNGYKVLSGTWTTPSSLANVVASVPTVQGYTSFTTGDWEINADGTTSTTPANSFVFPTWAGIDTTVNGTQMAYPNNAAIYEATPTHTIYFVPDTTPVARRITAQFTKLKQNADGTWATDGQVQPDSQMDVYYNQSATAFATNGSTDHTKWTINYDWQWDSAAGDTDTPGFHIVSGSWNHNTIGSAGHPTTGSVQVVVPDAPSGYFKAASPIGYDLSYFANPTTPPASTIFTNDTDSTLYMRNKLIFYYVPNSALSKNVTRTINIADPVLGRTQTTQQTVTFTRTVQINGSDDGVNPSNWTNSGTTSWPAQDITRAGYTALIDGTVGRQIAEKDDITANTADETVNVTYVQNVANVTIAGAEQDVIYNGSPFAITKDVADEISHAVTAADSHLTLPTGADSVSLDQGDFQFVDNNGNTMTTTMPTNVGTYRIILSDDGLNKFKALDSNFVWNYDPSTSYVVFKINPATPTVTFSATGSKTYDGSAIINNANFTGAPTVSFGGQAGANNVPFQSGDFEFINQADSSDEIMAAINSLSGAVTGPTNAGTYTIKLTAQGLQRIKDANPNFDLSQLTVDNIGTGTYTIYKYAPAVKISGSGQKTYDGQAVSSADIIKQDANNTITITLTVPKSDGSGNEMVTYQFNYNPNADYVDDYSWSDNGTTLTAAPKDAGTYTITLKSSGVQDILNNMLQSDSNFKYLQGNVDNSNVRITGQATYTINQKPLTVWMDGDGGKIYDASTATMPTDLVSHLHADGLVSGETLNTDTFDAADYQWLEKESDGTYKVITSPTNVGTYYIGILPKTSTKSGVDTLVRDNPNYLLTVDNSKHFTYTITKAAGTITLNGSQTDTYSGGSHTVAGYSLAIAGPGVTSADDKGQLQNGDLEFLVNGKWTTTVPIDAGTYHVRLAQSAQDFLAKAFPNLTFKYIEGTTNVEGTAFKDYVINPSPVTVSFTGTSEKTYDGNPINIAYTNDNFRSHFAANGVVTGQQLSYQDASADLFEWFDANGNVMTTTPTAAGTYTLKLKSLADVNSRNKNYTITWAKDAKGNEENGWTWTIDKATATIKFATGSQSTSWTGAKTVLDPNNFAVTITTNNGQTLTASGLTADDFDFYQNGQKIAPPTEIGDYTVKLNASGLAKVEQDTTDYTWTDDAVGSYHITKAAATISLNGSASTVYNGQTAVIPTNSDGSVKGITVTLDNGKTYTLQTGDLQFVSKNSKGNLTSIQAPTDAGSYLVTLSETGLDNINKLDSTHYTYSLGDANTATFTIAKANATINVSGTGTATYDGSAADLSKGNYTMQLPGQSTTTIDDGNLVFVDASGNEITAPSDAGTYKVALSKAEQTALQQQFVTNYNLTFTSDGNFTIAPKTVDLILNGTGSQTYNGKRAKITSATGLTLTWGDHTTTTAPGGVTFTLTPDDLTVLDSQDTSGTVPTDANSYDQDTRPYYIHLKDSVLAGLNSQNKNYHFEIGTTYARYTINAYQSNLTLTGKQFVNYGETTMPPLNIKAGNFTLTWTDVDGTTHTFDNLAADELAVVVPEGTPHDDNGMPINAGQYVVKVKDSVIENWDKNHPDYQLITKLVNGSTGSNSLGTGGTTGNQAQANTNAWYVVVHRQVGITINGTPAVTYNGQPATIKDGDYSISFTPVSGVTNSGQAARDSAAFKGFKLTAADLEFVNGAPTDAGTYQVQLSAKGLQDLQNFANKTLSGNYDFSSVVTVDANGNFTSSSVTANYTINQMPLTVHLSGSLSHVMGDYTLPVDGNYTLTITTQDGEVVKDASGQPITFTYTLQDGDVVYTKDIPNAVGTYDVELSPDALNKIEAQYGTTNYTYTSTSDAKFNVTQGTGTLTVTGSQTVPYNGQAATLDDSQYQLVIHTNVGDITLPLTGESSAVGLGFYQKDAQGNWQQVDDPTNVGAYVVGIDPTKFSTIENNAGGANYKWTQAFDTTYTITAVNGTATANYTNNRDYNGKAIGDLSIPITLNCSSATNVPTTYTLQKGDYELVGPDGTVYNDPTAAGTSNAGTYTIKLTQQGQDYINQHFGNVADASGKITSQNVNWTYGDTLGTYTINPVRMMVTVDGSQTTTYNGQAYGLDGQLTLPTITLGTQDAKDQGVNPPTIPTTGANALTADDFTITDFDDPTKVVNPTAAGHYRVYLNATGFAKLAALSPNFTYPTSVTSYGLLTINPKAVTVTEGRASKTFNAQTSALTAGQFAAYKKAITDAGYNADNLTVDDLDWWFDTNNLDYGTQDNPKNPIKDAGTYCLRLNTAGQQQLAQDNPNYNITVDAFVYHIYPEVVHIGINQGPQNVAWDNLAVTVDPTDFTPTFTVYGGANGDQLITTPVRDDGQTLTVPTGVNMTAGDYEFVDDQGKAIKTFTREDGTTTTTPFKIGTYHIRLTDAGWQKLATYSTDNVRYQYGDGKVTMTTPTNTTGTINIQQVTPTISLNGGNWKIYDGQPVSLNQTIYENGSSNGRQLINATFTVNGQTIVLPLTANDFIWTSSGQDLQTAPSAVGIYGIRLNKDQFISDVSAWVSQHPDYTEAIKLMDPNIDGSATYEIRALVIAKISAQPSSKSAIYNGQEAQIDLNDLAGKVQATDAGGQVWTLSTNGLTLADFSDANGHAYTSFPLNVGTYTFTLNSDGINVLRTNNPNFTIPDTVGSYSYVFTLTPAEAKATLSGSAEKNYDGQKTTTANINGGTSTIAVSIGADKTIYYTLQDGDYDWYSQDGKTKLSGAPVNAGTYTIKLNNVNVLEHLRDKIAQDPDWTVNVDGQTIHNVKIDKTDLSGSATFTINKVNAQLSMSGGTIQRTYTGSQIAKPVSDLRNDISASGLIDNDRISTSGLTGDDFDWVDENGNPVTSSQINVGTYYIQLNAKGLSKLEKGLTGNYHWNVATNLVKVTVGQKDLNVFINSTGKVYDGNPVSDLKSQLQASGLTGRDSLNTDKLSDADFTWTNASGKTMDADPTNVGTYTLALTAAGLAQLQQDNSNYNISGSAITYTIRQAAAQVFIVGDQTYTPTSGPITDSLIDLNDFNASYLDEYPGSATIPSTNPVSAFIVLARDGAHQIVLHLQPGDLTFVNASGTPTVAPTHPGDYYVGLTDTAFQRIQNENPNYKLSYGSGGQVHIKGVVHYVFEDTQNGNVQVGTTTTVNGLLSDGIRRLHLRVPTNYKLADGQTLPTSYTVATSDPLVQTVDIKLKHKTETINQDDIPIDGQTPTGTPLVKADFAKDLKRTITAKEPTGDLDLSQTTTLTRTATYDLVTKRVTNWGEWSTGSFTEVDAPTMAGYTLSQASVAADSNVTSNYTDPDIVITYTANNQTLTIRYIDDDKATENLVKTSTLAGKTGQTLTDLGLTLPEHYVWADESNNPTSFKLTVDPTENVLTVHLKERVDDVQKGLIPTGSNVTDDDLSKTITRTVNVAYPDSYTGEKPDLSQNVTFTRTGIYNEVTGIVTWNAWSEDGRHSFGAITAPTVPGYTAQLSGDPADVITVTPTSSDTVVVIAYSANDQSMSDKFVDDDNHGAQVGSLVTLNGKTDQTVDTGLMVPADYALASGQTLPTTYTFGPTNPAVTIHLVHQTKVIDVDHIPDGGKTPDGGDLLKTDFQKRIKRTITAKEPTGDVDLSQATILTRKAIYDLVTRKVTKWSDWSISSFANVNAPTVAGYTPSPTSVAADNNVDSDYTDPNIIIAYTANEQTGKISYIDVNNRSREVGTTPLSGTTGLIVTITPQAPAGWVIVPGQKIPATETATVDGIATVTVKVEHGTITVNPGETAPSGKVPGDPSKNYESMADLTKTPMRTITIMNPDGSKNTIAQQTKFTRTATFDTVTGEVTYNDWSPVGTTDWAAYTPATVFGYQPSQARVNRVTTTADTADTSVTITYNPLDQTGKVSYVDQSGAEIAHDPLTGKTGATIAVTPHIPAGWVEVPGHTIPTSVTATADGIPTVRIIIKHGTTTVNPGGTAPTGKVPGDPSKNYESMGNLTKDITRTITVNIPNGQPVIVPQVVTFQRTATFDNVTGQATYSTWTAKDGKNTWNKYTPRTIAGYAPDLSSVVSQTVTADTKDTNVTVNYIADGQTAKIIYLDGIKQVATQEIGGKAGQTVEPNYQVPVNYELDGKQPLTYRFTTASDQQIIVHLLHQTQAVTRSQTITETVHYTGAGSLTPSDNVQTITVTENGVKDLVTGETKWTPAAARSFGQVDTPVVAGYTADVSVVPSAIVHFGDSNITKMVTYTANDQSGKLIYVDRNGSQISQTNLHGKTGKNVTISPVAPTGWKIIPGQTIPTMVKATASGIPTVYVLVEHEATPATQRKDITRTIVVTTPDGKATTTKQVVYLQRTATTDQVTGDVTYSPWTADGTDQWAAFMPAPISGYVPSLDSVSAVTVNGDTTDAHVAIDYLPLADAQSATVIYVDDDNGDSQVGGAQTISGRKEQTVELNLQVPTGYELAKNQPTTYTFTDRADQVVKVHLIHHQTGVTDQYKVTRTIVVIAPDGMRSIIPQTVTLTRSGARDDVIGVTTYGLWNTGYFAQFTAPTYAGYTPSQSEIPAEGVTHETTSSTVTITYAADAQTVTINFIDTDHGNQVVATSQRHGKIDQTLTELGLTVPAHYELISGQILPTSYNFMTAKDQIITIKLQEKISPLDPNKIPDGTKNPDNSNKPVTPDDFNKTVKRAVTVKYPAGYTGAQPGLSQQVTFIRTGTYNEVTGVVTWGAWSENGRHEFAAITVPTIADYTAEVDGNVSALMVGPNSANSAVTINYSQNQQPTLPTEPTNPTHQPTGNSTTAPTQQLVTPTYQPSGNSTIELTHQPTTHPTRQLTTCSMQQSTSQPTMPGQSSPVAAKTKPGINGSTAVPGVSAGYVGYRGGTTTGVTNHNGTRRLPQTGNDTKELSTFGFLFATLASLLGLAGRRKKREDQ